MKIRFFFTLMILTFGALGVAVDTAARSEKWGLPEGARLRIGKGTISKGSNVIEYSPDGTQIALASSIGIWIYDARTYQERALLGAHSGVVLSIAYSPNGNMLVSGSEDGTVQFWDTTSDRLLRTIKSGVEFDGRPAEIRDLAFSSGGDTIAHSAGTDIHLRSAATGQLLKTLMGPERKDNYEVTCLAFSPDGSTIVSSDSRGFDGNAYLWSVATGKLLREIEKQQLEGIEQSVAVLHDVAFSPDGSTIVGTMARGFGGTRMFLTPASLDKPLTTFEESEVARATFSPDGSTIAVRPTGGLNHGAGPSLEGEIALMSAATGEVLKILRGTKKYDGIEITEKVREGTTYTTFEGISRAYPGFMTDIAFSPDGSTIAAVGGGNFFVWSATTGERLKEIIGYTDEPKGGFAFSPDGTTLAFIKDGAVEFWSIVTGKFLGECIGGVHNEGVQRISFTSDGEKIVTRAFRGKKFWLLDIDKSFALMKTQPTATGVFTDLTEKKRLMFDKERNSVCYRIEDVCIIDVDEVDEFDSEVDEFASVRVATRELRKTINVEFSDYPVLSPDGSTIAGRVWIDGNPVLQLFSVATGELRKTINVEFDGYPIFSLDGSAIATQGEDGTILLWDTR